MQFCVLYFLFLRFFIQFWKTCQLIGENVVFPVIFDTCDVMYNWSLYLLETIVLDSLFVIAKYGCFHLTLLMLAELILLLIQ